MPSIRELIHDTKSFHVNLQIISIRYMCKVTMRFSITNILLWDECDSLVEIHLDHFPSLNSSYIVHVVITLQMKLIEFSRLLKKKKIFFCTSRARAEISQKSHKVKCNMCQLINPLLWFLLNYISRGWVRDGQLLYKFLIH